MAKNRPRWKRAARGITSSKGWRRRVKEVLLREEGHCIWCMYQFTLLDLVGLHDRLPTIEHIWPISSGSEPDDISNLALACHKCNK